MIRGVGGAVGALTNGSGADASRGRTGRRAAAHLKADTIRRATARRAKARSTAERVRGEGQGGSTEGAHAARRPARHTKGRRIAGSARCLDRLAPGIEPADRLTVKILAKLF